MPDIDISFKLVVIWTNFACPARIESIKVNCNDKHIEDVHHTQILIKWNKRKADKSHEKQLFKHNCTILHVEKQ